MLEGNMYIRCNYCKCVSIAMYHNTLFPYCRNCGCDSSGEKIYLCGSCGVHEPGNRMETETTCQNCWTVLVAA
jgi:hypothetical protein